MLRVGEVKLSVVSARLRLATLDLGIPSTRFRLVCLFCLSYLFFIPLCILIRPLCIGIRGAPVRLFGPMTGKLGHVLGVSDAAISPRFGHNTLNIQDLRTKSSISIHSLLLLHHHPPPPSHARRIPLGVYIKSRAHAPRSVHPSHFSEKGLGKIEGVPQTSSWCSNLVCVISYICPATFDPNGIAAAGFLYIYMTEFCPNQQSTAKPCSIPGHSFKSGTGTGVRTYNIK